MTAATNNPISSFHRGISVGAITSYPDGGTSGTPRGKWFGSIITANLNSGATNWEALSGQEIDVTANSGSSVLYKSGLAIVHQSTDAVRGSLMDAGLLIADQPGSAVGWKNLFSFGSVAGTWAGASDSILIGTLPTLLGGSPYVADRGIDLSAVTFGTAFERSTGWQVDGSGNVNIGSNTLTWGTSGLTVGTAGSVSTAVAVTAGGSGYAVGGHLRAAGGVFQISAVSGGAVTAVTTITPASVTGATPSNPVATTNNTGGSGATLTLTWTTAPGFNASVLATGGTTARTLAAWAADWNNAKNYGATGAGTPTVDLTALTATASPIYLPNGTFYTGASVYALSGNRRYYASGGSGVIQTLESAVATKQAANLAIISSLRRSHPGLDLIHISAEICRQFRSLSKLP